MGLLSLPVFSLALPYIVIYGSVSYFDDEKSNHAVDVITPKKQIVFFYKSKNI